MGGGLDYSTGMPNPPPTLNQNPMNMMPNYANYGPYMGHTPTTNELPPHMPERVELWDPTEKCVSTK